MVGVSLPALMMGYVHIYIYISHIFSEDTTTHTTCEFQQDLQLADLLVGNASWSLISAEPLLLPHRSRTEVLQVSSHRWLAYGIGFP